MTRRVRLGFTLIELLVVMGIITVLVGLAVLAFVHLQKAPAEGLTRTRLQMCASLLTEYDPTGSLMGIEGTGGWFPATGAQQSVYAKGANSTSTSPVGSPGDVTFGAGARCTFVTPTPGGPASTSLVSCPCVNPSPPPPDLYPNVVEATAKIFQMFARVPDVKAQINQLPGSALLQSTTGPWMDPSNSQPLPVILDGWKNPIIYVPTGGLTNVYVGGPPPPAPPAPPPTTGIWGKPATIKSVDGRPFWASAGADGSFTTGDDNLYSCPVIVVLP